MLHGHALILLVSAMAMSSCFGFIAERSAIVPMSWNIAPSLETEQKVTVDQTSSEKTQTTSADKVLQTTNTKTSMKAAEQTIPGEPMREKRSDSIVENVENKSFLIKQDLTKFVKDADVNPTEEHVATYSITSSPRNVILLLSADSGHEPDNFWRNLKVLHSFSVEGFLQNCNNAEMEGVRFSLEDILVTGNKVKMCDCDHFLRSNIVSLLVWARDVKGMTIDTFSNTNFTIPPLYGYEESVSISRELDETDENNMKQEIGKIKPEIHRDWHLIGLERSNNRASPMVLPPNSRDEEEMIRNVFDWFSKIRMALFGSLLESLGGNTGAPDDSIASSKPRFLRSNLVDVLSDMKSLQNEKGFILVAATSAKELDSAFDILQHEVAQDTLLIVTGTCSEEKKLIPYFAQGPAAAMLQGTTTVWDLPTVIQNIIGNDCQNLGCRSRRHDLPLQVDQIKIAPRSAAALERLKRDAVDNVEETVKDDQNSAMAKFETRNSAMNFMHAEKLTTITGIIVSTLTAFILSS